MSDGGFQSLTPETWGRVLSLLDEALDRPEAEREGWLESVDAAVRPALRQLLAERKALETAKFLSALPALMPSEERFAAGGAVGPWSLLRKLGEGGMASVWLAERSDGEHRRQVALKLPWLGSHAPVLGERFARERQLLSSLEHPNIAGLLDAGTDAGQPWLAMEYVEGVSLLQWADERALDARARVALFLQVLSAVQYAHSQFVIHRDVKPANVLVDARGQVKLLDFGVAKLLDEDGEAAETHLTRMGGRALTPQYASPEQLAGQPLATTSDVYSLGLLLYELLSAHRPYTLERAGLAETERTVRQARIKPPSELAEAARARALRGDLDTIVLKALSLEPRQRYASAEAFARDLERHLAWQPIEARPPSLAYRVSRTWARNRVVFSAGIITIVALAVGLGIAVTQTLAARQQARRAEAAKSFLVGVFKGSDARVASAKPRGTITARELLDENVDRISTSFADDVETQLELLALAGEIYGHLGEGERSAALLQQRAAKAREAFGENHPAVIEGQLYEAWAAIEEQHYADALRTLDEAKRGLVAAKLEDGLLAAEWWLARGEALRATEGSTELRLAAYGEAIARYERLDPQHDSLVAALANTGTVLLASGRLAEAKAIYERALAVAKVAHDRDDTGMAMLWGNLAVIQRELGDSAALASVAQAEALSRATVGEDDPVYWFQAGRRAEWASEDGDRAEAERLFVALLAHVPEVWERNTAHATVWDRRGRALLAQGEAVAALPWLEGAERIYVERPYRESDLRALRTSLGAALDEAGRPGRAREFLKLARDEYLAREPESSGASLLARERWARFLLGQGERDEAKLELEKIIAAAKEPQPAVALARVDQARLALALGDTDQAVRLSEQASSELARVTGSFDVRVRALVQLTRAEALLAASRASEAQPLALDAWRTLEKSDGPDSPLRKRAERLAHPENGGRAP